MKTLFQKTLNEIIKNPAIRVIHNRWNPMLPGPLAMKMMRGLAKEKHGEVLSEELTKLSDIASNTHVCWQAGEDNATIGAEFFLKGLAELYSKTLEEIPVLKSFGNKLPPAKELSIFEEHPEFGDGQHALVHRKNAEKKNSVWFYQNGYVYSMSLSYREYLEKLCETHGVAWWQLFFSDFKDDEDNRDQHKVRMKKALDAMKELFPDNYSHYEEIYNKL